MPAKKKPALESLPESKLSQEETEKVKGGLLSFDRSPIVGPSPLPFRSPISPVADCGSTGDTGMMGCVG